MCCCVGAGGTTDNVAAAVSVGELGDQHHHVLQRHHHVDCRRRGLNQHFHRRFVFTPFIFIICDINCKHIYYYINIPKNFGIEIIILVIR